MFASQRVVDLDEPLLGMMFLQTTCVKANIHFPFGGVLSRAGVKRLMLRSADARFVGVSGENAGPAKDPGTETEASGSYALCLRIHSLINSSVVSGFLSLNFTSPGDPFLFR
jgi:hypothetical protein